MDKGAFAGLLSKHSEKLAGEIGDKLIVAKNKFAEAFDGKGIMYGTRLLDNWLGDKVPDQAVVEPLANKAVVLLHDHIVNENQTVKVELIDTCALFVKEVAPLEKLITQHGEDIAMDFIRDLVVAWIG